jgi:pyruvate carboxylase subunit A
VNKVLVANRGEIALRIMKTLKGMGIKTVAVYSEVDRNAPFVLFADEAILLGPAPSSQSYLVMEKVIQAAKDTGAQGIHPGYGFLSENAEFAIKVQEAGIEFIGPPVKAIRQMGSKLAAKEAALAQNVPMVPGLDKAIDSMDEAREVAGKIGYPVLIKASAGGGGKGMRLVHDPQDLEEQINRAKSEAQNSFGDPAVFMEKYVSGPRHIEIQVLADKHGNCVYLFERECSIQRRHQKVVEEAPSALLTPKIRKEMGEAAVRLSLECGYVGAGTVEFLADDQLNWYFLEMNTRLQVEHPVTEMITGLDLVEWQIRVARGENLGFAQEELKINGHSIELRVYAEDPMNQFLPSIGTLNVYKAPKGDGIRVDDGFREGMDVPIYYDPMISKLVVHAENRVLATQKMLDAISNYQIEGVSTTLPFGKFVFNHAKWNDASFDTHFVQNEFSPEKLIESELEEATAAAQFGLNMYLQEKKKLKLPVKS